MSTISMAQSTMRKKEEAMPASGSVRQKRKPRGGEFKCSLCGNGFSRPSTIRYRHWAICVKKNGNPGNLSWDQDQTCWPKGKLGPSGTPARGLTERPGDDTEDKDGDLVREFGAMDGTTDIEETLGSWVTSYLMELRYHN